MSGNFGPYESVKLRTSSMKDRVNFIPMMLLAALAAILIAALMDRFNHPHHDYDAADLARDTKTCEQLGFKVKARMFHHRFGDYDDNSITGADCVGPDGGLLPIPEPKKVQP